MNRIIAILLTSFLLSSTAMALSGKNYGQPLTLTNQTLVSQIMEKPDNFVGKTVLIQGTVVEVCSHKGCWMDIASDAAFEKIQVKVADGEIVFPLDARGKNALVEGVVEKIEISKEQIIQYRQHHAEMHGTEFDPSSVTKGEVYYRIKGLGAVIEN